MVTLVPDRAQRARRFHFSLFSLIAPCRLKTQNTAKKNVKKAPIMEEHEPIHTCIDSKFTSTGSRSNLTISIDSTYQLFI